MSESWKTPTAVIGLITAAFTILTFVYTEYKKDKQEQQKSEKDNIEAQRSKDSIDNAKALNESRISIERKIKELDQEIAQLNESATIIATKCNESKQDLDRFEEKNKDRGLSGREKDWASYKKESDRLDWIYVYNFRDSTDIVKKIKAVEMEKRRFSDSLHFYYKQ